MYKFVKLYDSHYKINYDKWLLLLESPEDLDHNMEETLNVRTDRTVQGTIHGKESDEAKAMRLHAALIHRTQGYRHMLEKGKRIAIQQHGSYFPIHDKIEIVEECHALDFPLQNAQATIAVIENDRNAEYSWRKYLAQQFPNQPYKVLNFFSTRSPESIKADLEGVKYITFTTTFENYDWYRTLTKAMTSGQEIIGHCKGSDSNDHKWLKAVGILHKFGPDATPVQILNGELSNLYK